MRLCSILKFRDRELKAGLVRDKQKYKPLYYRGGAPKPMSRMVSHQPRIAWLGPCCVAATTQVRVLARTTASTRKHNSASSKNDT